MEFRRVLFRSRHRPAALLAGRDLLGGRGAVGVRAGGASRGAGGVAGPRSPGRGRRAAVARGSSRGAAVGRGWREIAGVLAGRVVAAAHEGAVAAEAHQQLRAAVGTFLVERHALALDVAHLLAGSLEVPRELLVEVGDRLAPLEVAVLDLVELPLAGRGVPLAEDVVEAPLQHAVGPPPQGP